MKKTESAGGVVLNTQGQVLIVNQAGRSWSLPKGHLDAGETPLDAARREIYEESGIARLEFRKDLGVYERYKISLTGGEDRSELKKIHMFYFETDEAILRPGDPQIPQARWVDKAKVADWLTHDKDKEFFLGVLPVLP